MTENSNTATTQYTYNKRWRKNHPEKWRDSKRRYILRNGNQDGKNVGKRWTYDEVQQIIDHDIPDRKLAIKLGRSLGSLQLQRSLYKKEMRLTGKTLAEIFAARDAKN